MTKTRKSKHDLTDVAYLKIPKKMYLEIKDITNKDTHWSEKARDLLDNKLDEAYAIYREQTGNIIYRIREKVE